MSRFMRLTSFSLALSVVASLFVLTPASAAPIAGTASVNLHEVVPGAAQEFIFTVTNGAVPAGSLPTQTASGPAYDWVRIGSDTPGAFTISNGSAAGWTYDTDSQGNARFRAGSIAPGASKSFTISATPAATPTDVDQDWVVEVSDNNGRDVERQSGLNGALTTTIRVLRVDSVSFSNPSGALDNTVTSGQSNTTVTTVVANRGSAPLSVTPSLSTSGGDTAGSTAAKTINAGSTASFVTPVTIGGDGTRTFGADAAATGADAISKNSDPFTAQAPADFDYVANSLSPLAASSGTTQQFLLSVDKSNIPSVNFNLSASELTFTKANDASKNFTVDLASPASTGSNDQSLGLAFAPTAIPGSGTVWDGLFNVDLTLVGTDDNGAPVSKTVDLGDIFEIDNLAPVPLPTLSGPTGQVTPDNAPVIKDGNTLTVGGTVKRSGAEDAPADTTAVVTKCDLVVLSNDFVEMNRIPVPLTSCTNNNGNLQGSAAPATLGVDEGWVRLEVAATDTAGQASPAVPSNLVKIDNEIPDIHRAVTGCGAEGFGVSADCKDLQTVRVFLSEPVKGMFSPLDFSVLGHTVLNATARNTATPGAACAATAFCNAVVLTLAPTSSLTEDAKPGVEYEFSMLPPGRARPQDGPKNNLVSPVSVQAIDGIVPDLPSLDSVTQDGLDASGGATSTAKAKQGDAFYTNDSTPSFTISGLSVGYTGIVAQDSNANGDFNEGDTILAQCEALDATATCDSLGNLGTLDATLPILVASLDADGNLSQGRTGALTGKFGRPETLVYDRSAPTATTFATGTGRQIVVTLSELVPAGRDFAEDWFTYVKVSGTPKRMVISSVNGTGALRNLNISANETRWAGGADIVTFSFNGTPDLRYQDRAGNYLGDFTIGS